MAEYTVGQLMEMRAVLDQHCQVRVEPAFAAQLRRARRLVGEHVREFQEEIDRLVEQYGEKAPGQGYIIRVNSPAFPEFEQKATEIRNVSLDVELKPELRLSQFPQISGNEVGILDPVLIDDTQESAT
jgi:hypothetical protein